MTFLFTYYEFKLNISCKCVYKRKVSRLNRLKFSLQEHHNISNSLLYLQFYMLFRRVKRTKLK